MQDTLDRIYNHIDQHFDEHLAAAQDYMRQPSISTQNIGIQECAELTAGMLREMGADARPVPLEGGHPVVYGHLPSNSSDRTLLFYGMYDVQPVEPLDAWDSPPFEANVVGDRIIARGAFNSKGPLMAFINGVRSVQAVTGDVPVNIIFVIEGEEELGSRNLPQFIEKHTEELKAAEGVYFHLPTEIVRGIPQVILGCKGVALFELEVRTLSTDAHSLSAPVVNSPVWRLIWALNSMRGADDRIVIDGFYDHVRPPDEGDTRLLADLTDAWGPDGFKAMYDVTDFRHDLQGTDFVREAIFAPTLNIDGFLAGQPEAGLKTIVPASAKCQIDIRLVPDMTVQDALHKVRAHLDQHGYQDVTLRPLAGYDPARISADEPLAQAAVRSIRKLGLEPKILPMLPGTGPIIMFNRPPLNLPFVTSGLGHGWLMHAPNEYFEVEGLRACEKSAVAFLHEFAATT
jgi:acetylornithine deacetylase/succinyl-diaminopimelate desuccinylase-like protein